MGPMGLQEGRTRSRKRWWWQHTVSLLVLALLLKATVMAAHSPGGSPNPNQPDDDLLDDEVTVDEGVTMKLDDYEIEYKTPVPPEAIHFYETFDDVNQSKKVWIHSRAHKEDNENVFRYEGQWDFDLPERRIFPNDFALVLRSKAKHAAISAKLDRKFEFNTKPLYVQYEVTFQNGMDCGGAYIKLLSDSKDLDLKNFHDKTPYSIMFGPDKCGSDVKLHFIFRHKNPLNGSFEEKHAKRPSNRMEDTFSDKKPHLYRLVLKPDNRFEVFVDGMLINQGDLLEDMEPAVNPPIEVEDPDDVMPGDWDERERIPDENAIKPADWDDEAPPKIPDPSANLPDGWLEDEPEMVPDPAAKVPEDWDESMDGEWEAPLIPNPKCEESVGCGPWTAPLVENPSFKGKWQAPTVLNPNFKGKWTRRLIPNPDYFEDKEPYKMTPIGAVGLEIWTMTDLVLFDNFIITDKESVVADFTEATYNLKMRALERDSRGVFERIINYSNSHPWLYAVYTIVIGLPVVLIIAFCCGGQDKRADPVPVPEEEDEDDDVPSTPPSSRRAEPLRRSRNTVTQYPAPPESENLDKTAAAQQKKKSTTTGAGAAALSKDDLEQPEVEKQVAAPSQANGGDDEEEDDEGWVQAANPDNKSGTSRDSKSKASTANAQAAPAVNDESEDEEDVDMEAMRAAVVAGGGGGDADQGVEEEEEDDDEEEDEDEDEAEESGEQGNSDDEEEDEEEQVREEQVREEQVREEQVQEEEDDEEKAPEPVDQLIPEMNDQPENSNLKKRRTRRD